MSDRKPKIFAFVNGRASFGDYLPSALAEDGTPLAGHCSSSIGWAKHDIGIGSDWKHDKYRAHYPDGYELEWVDDVDGHPECLAAIAKANARAPEPKTERQESPSEGEGSNG